MELAIIGAVIGGVILRFIPWKKIDWPVVGLTVFLFGLATFPIWFAPIYEVNLVDGVIVVNEGRRIEHPGWTDYEWHIVPKDGKLYTIEKGMPNEAWAAARDFWADEQNHGERKTFEELINQ